MKNLNIICLMALLQGVEPLFGQEKHDFNWILGYASGYIPPGTRLDFQQDPPKIIAIEEFAFYGTSGTISMSDKHGTLQFYFDGCNIHNPEHQIMDSGDSINAPGKPFQTDCIQNEVGYFLFQGALALPVPDSDSLYYLFHLRCPEKRGEPDDLLYSMIDMSANNGLGKVMQKNVLIGKAPFADALTAVRHGNGRDWWVVLAHEDDVFHTILVTPDGLETRTTKAGFSAPKGRRGNTVVFSPDGNKFAQRLADGSILQMCFDRCSGQFSCPKITPVNPSPFVGGGLAYSPNSKFLYVCFVNDLYQFDAESPDNNKNRLPIARYDGFVSTFPTNFFRMMLAPDGKIYMCASNGTDYLHIIHAPDFSGAACDFRQHDIKLAAYNGIGMPNIPHYRLYDLPRSPCDTLGIDTPENMPQSAPWAPLDGIDLYPNPASDYINLAVAACESGRVRVVSTTGQVLFERNDWRGPLNEELDTRNWPAGVYFVQLYRYKFGVIQTTKKFVVTH